MTLARWPVTIELPVQWGDMDAFVMFDYRGGKKIALAQPLREAIEKLEASAPDPGHPDADA